MENEQHDTTQHEEAVKMNREQAVEHAAYYRSMLNETSSPDVARTLTNTYVEGMLRCAASMGAAQMVQSASPANMLAHLFDRDDEPSKS